METLACHEEAFEIIVGGSGASPVLITCEHASNRLPDPWQWPEEDTWIRDLHWAWDIGADALTRGLAESLSATAVASRFTRLLIDANRSLDMKSLFRKETEGRAVHLNASITDEERSRRIEGYWRPYHHAIDQCIDTIRPSLVLAIHSYTPVFEGEVRDVEMGVLHSGQPELAGWWYQALDQATEMDVRIDEPYSGANGFMYSPDIHAAIADCPAIELEIRQDIVGDPTQRPELIRAIADVTRRFLARGR